MKISYNPNPPSIESSAQKNHFDAMLIDTRNRGQYYISCELGKPPHTIWEHQKMIYARNGWNIASAPVL